MRALRNRIGVRDAIIGILSADWPLSLKEIYSKLKSKYGVSVTYQAAHKHLHNLIEEKIVSDTENRYSLDLNWIKSSNEKFAHLEKAYTQQKLTQQLPKKVVFNSYYEMYSFVEDVLFNKTIPTLGKPICFIDRHWWNTTILTKEQVCKLEEITKNNKYYCIAKCDGPLDNIFMNFWKSYGMRVKTENDLQVEHGTIIIGDIFIQILYPKEFHKIMDELANSAATLAEINLKKMQSELVYKKTEIIFLITEDKDIAERIRQDVLSSFGVK